jgi:hypothetical protein
VVGAFLGVELAHAMWRIDRDWFVMISPRGIKRSEAAE